MIFRSEGGLYAFGIETLSEILSEREVTPVPCLPEYVLASLREAVPLFDKKLRGYALPDAVLTGVETRSSSPVRICRDETGQATLRGLFPCGEGAGYAGGILSAAVDGMRQAENALAMLREQI